MSDAAEKLKAAILKPPVREQLEIADFVYASLAPPPGRFREGSPEFDAELDRRLAEMESGHDIGVPAEEVFERLRKKYQR